MWGFIHSTGRRAGLAAVAAVAACGFGEISEDTAAGSDDVAYDVTPAAETRSGAAAGERVNGARAILRDAAGNEVGLATLESYRGSVRVHVSVQGIAAGRHGFHIHEVGRCEPPDFESAGGHFAPLGRDHGMENADGPHAGDLPNLHVMADGRGENDSLDPWLSLDPQAESYVMRPGGTALIVHAGTDDYFTDPAGNSGARIACGVVEPA